MATFLSKMLLPLTPGPFQKVSCNEKILIFFMIKTCLCSVVLLKKLSCRCLLYYITFKIASIEQWNKLMKQLHSFHIYPNFCFCILCLFTITIV